MSHFAKRHYEAIAQVMQEVTREANFNGALTENGLDIIELVIKELADTFAADNSRFDCSRFEHACLPGSNVKAKTAHLKEKEV